MKSNIYLKIERYGLSIGLIGAAIFIVKILFWSSFSNEAHRLFYGGEPIAIILATFIIIGILSFLLFIVNLLFKRFSAWWLRLLGFLLFFLSIAFIGASSI